MWEIENGVIKTNFLGEKIPKENMHYNCIALYWFCYENGKEKLSAGLLRRMQIQNGKNKTTKFIKAELESESQSELGSGIELELKSELESDTE